MNNMDMSQTDFASWTCAELPSINFFLGIWANGGSGLFSEDVIMPILLRSLAILKFLWMVALEKI